MPINFSKAARLFAGTTHTPQRTSYHFMSTIDYWQAIAHPTSVSGLPLEMADLLTYETVAEAEPAQVQHSFETRVRFILFTALATILICALALPGILVKFTASIGILLGALTAALILYVEQTEVKPEDQLTLPGWISVGD